MAAGADVRGRVLDEADGKAVEFANIAARSPDGKIAALCVSDEYGKFLLKVPQGGKFGISVSFTGYARRDTTVVLSGEPVDLGDILLRRSSEEIAAAGIAEKALITRESDRIVYDVSADPDAARTDMKSFMSKIPGLQASASSGKLEYKDRPITKIMIDDKNSPMINAGRQYPMNFIKADYMSKIELILPGSPEYGNTEPVLVVTLDRALPFGAAMEISGDASTTNAYELAPDVVINTPIVGVGLSYDFGYSHSPGLTKETVRTLTDSDSRLSSSSWSRNESMSHDLGLDLFRTFLNDRLDLNVSLNAGRSVNDSRASTNTVRTVSGVDSLTSSSSFGKNVSPFRLNAGVSATYTWKRGNSLALKYSFKNAEPSSTETFDYGTGETGLQNLSTESTKEHNVSARLKLRPESRKYSFSAESGYMYRDYEDFATYWSGSTGGMDYTQGVAYAYGSFSGNVFDRKLSYGLSCYAEYVKNRGINLNSGNSLDYDEFSLTPSIRLSWRVSKTTTVASRLSVIKRRPRQEQLDPYRDETDPYNVSVGNPDLKGETTLSPSIQLSQDFRKTKWMDELTFGIFGYVIPDGICSVSHIEEGNVRVTTWENVGRHNELDMKLAARFKPISQLSVMASASAGRSYYSYSGGSNSYWSFSGNMLVRLSLKPCVIICMLDLSPTASGVQTSALKMEPRSSISVGRNFSKRHLIVSAGVRDLFHSSSYRREVRIAGAGFQNVTYNQRLGRSAFLNISWTIGKFKNSPKVEHSSYDM